MTEKQKQILDLFYNHHLNQVQIAKKLSIDQSYVSRVVTATENYIKETQNRHDEVVAKRPIYQKEYQKKYKRPKKEDSLYQSLKAQHDIDVRMLSFESRLSDESYRKSNSSAYRYNSKKHRFELDRTLKTSIDVPKYISTIRKLRPQKYKKPYFVTNY